MNYNEALAAFDEILQSAVLSAEEKVSEVRKFVSNISGDVLAADGASSQASRLLYSGDLPDGRKASTVALELADGIKNVTVWDSEVGKFLSNQTVVAKLETLSKEAGILSTDLINGVYDATTGTRVGLWESASSSYVVDAPRGANFNILADKPWQGSTFATNELKALMARVSVGIDTGVQGLNSESTKALLKVYANGVGSEADKLADLARAVNLAGEYRAIETGIADAATAALGAAEKSSYLEGASKLLSKAGPYAAGFSLLLIAGQANAAVRDGNPELAMEIRVNGLLDFAGGLAGGFVAAEVVGLALTPLLAAGPAGAIVAGAAMLAAGIAGALGGEALAHKIAGMFGWPGTSGSTDVATGVVTNPDGTSSITTTYPDGSSSVLTKDADGNVVNIVTDTINLDGTSSVVASNFSGNLNSLETKNYDADDQLVSSITTNTDPYTGKVVSGNSTTYSDGAITNQTDFNENGSTTTNWDPETHLLKDSSATSSDGSSSHIQYDDRGMDVVSASITDADGNTTTAATNPDGSVTTNYPDGSVSLTATGDDGLPTVYTSNPDGSVTTISYDMPGTQVATLDGHFSNITEQNGNPTRAVTTNPDGSGSEVVYKPDGSGSSYSYDADGNSTSSVWDPNGHVSQRVETSADGSQDVTTYAWNGKPATQVSMDADGAVRNTVYNSFGEEQEVKYTNADGSTGTITHSFDGSTVTTVQAADGTVYNTYSNADGSSYALVTNPDGTTVATIYGQSGTPYSEQTTNADGSSITTLYNPDGSVASVTTSSETDVLSTVDGDGDAIVYSPTYQVFGTNAKKLTNPDGSTVTFQYTDGTSIINAVQMTFPDGSGSSMVFTMDGRKYLGVITNADGSGSETSYIDNPYYITFGPKMSPFYKPGREGYYRPGVVATNTGDPVTSRVIIDPGKVITTFNYADTGVLVDVSAELSQTALADHTYGDLFNYFHAGRGNQSGATFFDGNRVISTSYWPVSTAGKELVSYHVHFASDGKIDQYNARYTDGSQLEEKYFHNGSLLSSALTGMPDGTSLSYKGTAQGGGTETTLYADGTYVEKTKNPGGSTVITHFDAQGVKTSDSWYTRGNVGVDTFNADGSSSGTKYFTNGYSSEYTDDGHGNVLTNFLDPAGNVLGDTWSKADGTTGTDSFNPRYGSSSGTVQLVGGNTYSYNNDGLGNVSYRYQFKSTGNIEISAEMAKRNSLLFENGTNLSDLKLTATLGSDGKPALLIDLGGGKTLTIDGGLDGAVQQFKFQDGNTVVVANDTPKFVSAGQAGTGGTPSQSAGALVITGATKIIDGSSAGLAELQADPQAVPYSVGFQQLMAAATIVPITIVMPNGNLIFSASGHETFQGGAGKDTIYAFGGNNTLIAGAGVTTLVGGSGNDTFIVNHSADVVHAHYSGNSVESSASYSLATQAQGVQKLTLTGDEDLSAVGNALNNVITGNSGNNSLDGGGGNDTLIGGAGSDTYAMAFGMGSDIAVDSSTESSIVQLGSGLAVSALTASRTGNDLLLQIIGSPERMTVKNYYTGAQTAWTIRDESGQLTSIQEVLDATAASPNALAMAAIESSFKAQLRANIVGNLQGNGYTRQPDGSYRSTTNFNYLPMGLKAWSNDPLNVQHNVTYADGTTGSYSSQEAWVPVGYQNAISYKVDLIRDVRTVSNASTINSQSTVTSESHQGAWVPVTWDAAYWRYGTYTQTVPVTDRDGNVIGIDQQTITSTNSQMVERFGTIVGVDKPWWSTYSTDFSSALISRLSPLMSDSGILPEFAPVDIVRHDVTDTIEQIFVGDGNHTVYGGRSNDYGGSRRTTIVNAGSGDNVIYDAAFVYTGTGNNTVIGADVVYGGSGNNLIVDAESVHGGAGNERILNSGNADGGAGNDTLIGGDVLAGGAGNDLLIGGNTMIAGSGNDRIYTYASEAIIQIDPAKIGTVLVGGAGDTISSLDAIYRSMGIWDWSVAYEHAGSSGYYLQTEGGNGYYPDAQSAVNAMRDWGWDNITIEEAIDYGYATDTSNIEPLPVLIAVKDGSIQPSSYYATSDVPVVNLSANDYSSLAPYFQDHVLQDHTVEFSAGVSVGDLRLSWGEIMGSISGLEGVPPLKYATLNLSWGADGQSVQVLIPHRDDPLGSGVTGFTFADGTSLTMADMVAMAPGAPTLDPEVFQYEPGMGAQFVGNGYSAIDFGPGVSASQITLGLGSLMLRVGNGDDVIHIENFNPSDAMAANTIRYFNFSDGTSLSYAQLLSRGFDIYGTDANDVLAGTNLDNRIYGVGGGDTLIGTGANDTLVSGDGADTLIGGTGHETFVVNDAADVVIARPDAASNTVLASVDYALPDNVQNLTLTGTANLTAIGNGLDNVLTSNSGVNTLIGGTGNVTFVVNNSADVIVANPNAASNTVLASVDFELAEGLETLVLIGNGNATAKGNSLDNVLTGNAGNYTLIAGEGSDTLIAGAGNGTLIAGDGVTTFVFNADAGHQTIIESNAAARDVIRFGEGITSSDLVFEQRGPDMLVTFSDRGSVLIRNYDLFNTDTPPYFSQWQFSDGSSISIASGNDFDEPGSFGVSKYDADGNLTAEQWAYAGGGHGSRIYGSNGAVSATYYRADGSRTTYEDDGQGNTIESEFSAGGTLLSDTWSHADGTYGSDSYAVDGSSTAISHFPDGGRSETTNDGRGDMTMIRYDRNGEKISTQWTRTDGSYGSDSFTPGGSGSGTAHYPDGSVEYISYSDRRQYGYTFSDAYRYDTNWNVVGYYQAYDYGNNNTQKYIYDPLTGRGISSSWTNGDGSFGNDVYNEDGSRVRTENDGNGLVTVSNFDQNQVKLSDSWTNTDGSWGSDVFNPDGSYIGVANDGHGKTTTTNYDSNGNRLSGNWTSTDGAYGSDTFNADGTYSGTAQYPDGSYSVSIGDAAGTVTTDLFNLSGVQLSRHFVFSWGLSRTDFLDVDGRVTGDQWRYEDGEHGTSTYNLDGSSSGVAYDADGGYSTYTNDGLGRYYEQAYTEAGVKTGDWWSSPDGMYGNSTFFSDGSSSGEVFNDNDGSYSRYANDGHGNTTTQFFDADNNLLNYVVVNDDGQGNVHTSTFDAAGGLISDSWGHANSAPEATLITADAAQQGTHYTFHIPAGAFADPDAGDILSYSAKLADGSPLPSWLVFDVQTQTFIGTPQNADVGVVPVAVTATDLAGESVTATFEINVANTNDAPVVLLTLPTQTAVEQQPFTYTLPAGIFADIDAGDSLSFELTRADGTALPSWLTFNVSEMTVSGTPTGDEIGDLELLLIATDSAGATATQALHIGVQALPVVTGTSSNNTINAQPTGSILMGLEGNDTLSGNVGGDKLYGGAGADRLYGREGRDILEGGEGNDRLEGGLGADQMLGGLGSDTYAVDDAGDVVTELADEGTDTVEAVVDYALSANVEYLTLTGTAAINGTGNELNNIITGNAAGNTLRGLGGNDTLRGGSEADTLEGGEGNDRLDGGAGADQLVGGLGNDVYVVDEAGDVVVELADGGADTVQTALDDYTLTADVENLTLTGTVAINGTGNELNNMITGNAAGNTLRGLAGNDTLRGGLEADSLDGGEGNDRLEGGAGADQMLGGAGDDTYVVDEVGDAVVELADEGTDTVQSLVDYTLSANVENLTLTGTSATNGTGNELNNVITGNAAGNALRGLGGNDTLRGGLEADILEGGEGNDRLDGGAGADQLAGGLGNDVYVVDEAGDVVTELADEGTDTVQSLVDYTLGANLENLTLTGIAAISGTGNELNNVITGNAAGNLLFGLGGNDTLRGGLEADVLEGGEGNDRLDGGAGADQLAGGAGNDVYVVDEAGDAVTELADEGTDTVQSLVDYTLGANLENLTLTGTVAISGAGNELNNVITGNVAGNTLHGLGGNDTLRGGLEADTLEGGVGNDRLEGGAGADTYLFARGEGQDVLVETDATAGVEDVLQFGHDITAEQIWLRQVGNSLEISLIGSSDKVTVANWYLGTDRHVELLQLSDGRQLLDTQVQSLVQAMAAFTPPPAGQTTLPESYAATLTPVIAANWQ
ncbi:MAG: putative Ig domain-containing protein [Hylemonella sp.]|nr:putative Ig domain-containing protein [Hylemonella sp.]